MKTLLPLVSFLVVLVFPLLSLAQIKQVRGSHDINFKRLPGTEPRLYLAAPYSLPHVGALEFNLNPRQDSVPCGKGRFRCEKFPGCCSVTSTCFESSTGKKGCCPKSKECTTIGDSCEEGFYACLESEGGGCCRLGYVCLAGSNACAPRVDAPSTTELETQTHNIPSLTIVPSGNENSVPTLSTISDIETETTSSPAVVTTTATELGTKTETINTRTSEDGDEDSGGSSGFNLGSGVSTTTVAGTTTTTPAETTAAGGEGETGGSARVKVDREFISGLVVVLGSVYGAVSLLG